MRGKLRYGARDTLAGTTGGRHGPRRARGLPSPSATTATIRGGTRRRIDPAHHLALHQIHVHAIPKSPWTVSVGTAPKGRPEIVPVRGLAGIPRGVVGVPPHKQ